MNTIPRLTDEQLSRQARKRVGMKVGFFIHLLLFVLVNAGLFLLNYSQGGARWHAWPLGGWGIGLAAHGIVTFIGLQGFGLRERMVSAEIERLKAQQ